jgi:hypothetical protein
MSIQYICRYCQTKMGSLDGHELTESQLGFDQLTAEERADIITSDIDGSCQVRVVCESCQQLLERFPERVLDQYLFH